MADRAHAGLFCCAISAAFLVCPLTGLAQDLTPVDAETIAREAYIYGYPIVENYRRMYAFAIDQDGEQYEAPFNFLKHRDADFSPGDTSVDTSIEQTSCCPEDS